MALRSVASSCGPGTSASVTSNACSCYPYQVYYSSALGTYYCGDGSGNYGNLCICYTGTVVSWQDICDASYCMGQYCQDITGGCSYCSPGTYSAYGLSCVSCSTCSVYATTTGSCSGYGSTSDVSCTCNSGYTGNGYSCTKTTSGGGSSSSCSNGKCDTSFASCCLSNGNGPLAPSCYAGCFTCPAGSYADTIYYCNYCSSGTFSALSGSSACSNCRTGTYSITKGKSNSRFLNISIWKRNEPREFSQNDYFSVYLCMTPPRRHSVQLMPCRVVFEHFWCA